MPDTVYVSGPPPASAPLSPTLADAITAARAAAKAASQFVPDNFIRKDGTVPFLAAQAGITAAPGSNNTNLATTEFVSAAVGVAVALINHASGISFSPWTGGLIATDVQAAIQELFALKAELSSPHFTGVPTAPTATLGTNTTQIATTAFVKAAIDGLIGGASSLLDTLVEIDNAINNDPNFATTLTTALAGKQPLAANLTSLAALGSITNLSTLAALASIANLSTLAALASITNLSTLAALASVANLSTLAALASITTLSALATGDPPTALPTGRLTLVAGVRNMRSSVAAATSVIYTAGLVPIYDGTRFLTRTFPEVSQLLSDTTKSPAAASPNKNHDMLAWMDGATPRCTRSVFWRNSGQAILSASNATPIVIGATGHGLSSGDDYVGAGIKGNTAANGDWTVVVIDADSFSLTGSVGNGTYIANTGFFSSRGRGSGTAELQLINGIPTNKIAVANGPAANRGTYVGTIHINNTGTVDYILGGIGSGGGGGVAAVLGVWNAWNQAQVAVFIADDTDSWTYNTNAWRNADNSANMRASFVIGLPGGNVTARYSEFMTATTGTPSCGVGLFSSNQFVGAAGMAGSSSHFSGDAGMGYTDIRAIENGGGGTGVTFFGDIAVPANYQFGLSVALMM